jgi:hypothetical protein
VAAEVWVGLELVPDDICGADGYAQDGVEADIADVDC